MHACCDNFISGNFSFSERTSPVMIADVWNEIISPFLIGIVTEKDSVEVLKSFISSEFTPISGYIDAETLAKLDIDWTEYDWLEIEEIQEITTQKFVLEYISRREEILHAGNPWDSNPLTSNHSSCKRTLQKYDCNWQKFTRVNLK